MSIPLNITLRDMESTHSIEQHVRHWTDKLERVYSRIERCDVAIDRPHQSHHHGQQFRVRITVAIPGPDVVVSRDPAHDAAHEDVYVAIRDAFRAARRQLEASNHRFAGCNEERA
jgi:ribosomal subunit interface protein